MNLRSPAASTSSKAASRLPGLDSFLETSAAYFCLQPGDLFDSPSRSFTGEGLVEAAGFRSPYVGVSSMQSGQLL